MKQPIQIEAILFRKNKDNIDYLMLKRKSERGGFWQPITGGLEKGESKIEALKREIQEETGITNLIQIIENVHYFEMNKHYLTNEPIPTIKEYVFGVIVLPSESVIIDEKEHSQFKWCSFKKALELMKWEDNKDALKKLNKILCNSK